MTPLIYAGIPDKERKRYIFDSIPNRIDFITKRVFDRLEVDYVFIATPCRERHAVEARQISMYLVHSCTALTLKKIGEYFGRDHSTVIYACDTVKDLVDTNRRFKTIVDELWRELC